MPTQNFSIDTIMSAVRISGSFGTSKRRHDLLQYLLEEHAAGRGERIKAYAIALDVFDRDTGFDTSIDSIVRVEMHRLRAALKRFNETAKDFTLTIPASSYDIVVEPITHIPTPFYKRAIYWIGMGSVLALLSTATLIFSMQKNLHRSQEQALNVCSILKPNVRLIPSTVVGSERYNSDISLVMDNYLRTGMAQYSAVNTISNIINCDRSGTPSYDLVTTIFKTANQPYISLQVHNKRSRDIVYTKDIPIPADEAGLGAGTNWKIYTALSKLAYANGEILADAVKREWQSDTHKQDFQCLELALKHYEFFTDEQYEDALRCTQNASKAGTQIPEIYATLAIFYFEQMVGYRPKTIEAPLKEADALLEIADAISPQNAEVIAAQFMIQNKRQNRSVQDLKFLAHLLERKAPYHPHMLLMIARSYGYNIGDWEEAKRVSDIALHLDDTHFFIVYYVEFSYALLYESPEAAYNIALKLYHSTSKTASLMGLAAANKAGEAEHAQKCRDDLKALGLTSVSDYVELIEGREYEPKLTAELVKWLGIEQK